jgi:transposase-like protein
MDEQVVEKPKGTRREASSPRRLFSFSFKLRAVKLHLEQGISVSVIGEKSGISPSVIARWCQKYEALGEEGLKGAVRGSRASDFPVFAKERMIALKREEPRRGIRSIADRLRRFFFLPGSPETVRRTLHCAGLMEEGERGARRRNVRKPRTFERSTPNQMWQSDITMFRLGGTQVYLIGYIDDYSRYMVGAGLFATQKAAQVLEVYRQAVVEYGCPKEMLTDNGRQYTSWRGKTQFEARMRKDQVRHIRSTLPVLSTWWDG